ncbi:MAG: four helix bundle protein [Sedimentisphaerales bacterium]|jgi:four helix bundle protein
MTPEELKHRTKAFGLSVIKLVDQLPRTRSANTIGNQLVNCATSVGANYRAACRARSKAEFAAKLGIVEEEADESVYWIEMLIEAGMVAQERISGMLREANELVAIVVASLNTVKKSR